MDIAKINAMKAERKGLVDENRSLAASVPAEGRMTAEQLGEFSKRNDAIVNLDGNIEAAETMLRLDSAALRTPETREESRGEAKAGTDAPEYRAAFLKNLTGAELTRDEKRALSVGTTTAGGHTAPAEFQARLIEYARDFGVIEGEAFSFSTDTGNDLTLPVNDGHGASGWGTEAGGYTGTDPTFDVVTFGAHKAWHIAKISEELIQDSAIDIEAFLTRKMGEALGVLRGTAYAVGTGSGQPTGLMLAPTVGKTAASATAIDPDELIDLVHSVKAAYRRNGKFLVNDLTVSYLRKLKNATTDEYVWQDSLVAGVPSTLLGYPVLTDPDVDGTLAIDAYTVGFGDIGRAYNIRNAGGITIQRLNELYAGNGQVGFRVYARTDGQTVDPNAFKALKMAAS